MFSHVEVALSKIHWDAVVPPVQYIFFPSVHIPLPEKIVKPAQVLVDHVDVVLSKIYWVESSE